jgi:hypothetical protein
MVLVEFRHGRLELGPFHAGRQQLGYLRATLHVLGLDLPHPPFLCRPALLRLGRPERVLGELALVLLQRSLGLGVPYLPLIFREVLPGESDDLGECRVVCFYFGRNVLALNERRAEKNECIGGTGDVVLGLLLGMRRATRCGRSFFGGGKQDNLGRGSIHEGRGPIGEARGGDVGGERDAGRIGRLDRHCPHEALACETRCQLIDRPRCDLISPSDSVLRDPRVLSAGMGGIGVAGGRRCGRLGPGEGNQAGEWDKGGL